MYSQQIINADCAWFDGNELKNSKFQLESIQKIQQDA